MLAPVPLTHEMIERLRAVPHVEAVNASFVEYGRLSLNGRWIGAGIRPAPVTQRSTQQQIVAGSMPPSDSSRGVLVHEFLLYQLGVRDDADIERAIGGAIKLELYNHLRSPRILMALFDAQALTLTRYLRAMLPPAPASALFQRLAVADCRSTVYWGAAEAQANGVLGSGSPM